jgi:prepilin-type N-terminal cleavage/methylation domain-containing protein
MADLRGRRGFTLIEAVMVIAIIAIVATVASMSFSQSQSRTRTRDAVVTVAGMLQEARDGAVGNGVPYLVYFRAPGSCEDGRDPMAQIVRDNDSSYSPSAGDVTTDFTLEGVDCSITPYGTADESPYPDMPPADADLSQTASLVEALPPVAADDDAEGESEGLVGGLLGGGSGRSGSGSSGSNGNGCSGRGSCEDQGSHYGQVRNASSTPVVEVASNGATFPVDEDADLPAFAFTPNGVVVSLNTPTEWGSGAGAVYLTDNRTTVYAIAVSPLGQISIQVYNPTEKRWS